MPGRRLTYDLGVSTRRALVESPRFWLVVAALLVVDALIAVAVVGASSIPFVAAILLFALVSILNGLALIWARRPASG